MPRCFCKGNRYKATTHAMYNLCRKKYDWDVNIQMGLTGSNCILLKYENKTHPEQFYGGSGSCSSLTTAL